MGKAAREGYRRSFRSYRRHINRRDHCSGPRAWVTRRNPRVLSERRPEDFPQYKCSAKAQDRRFGVAQYPDTCLFALLRLFREAYAFPPSIRKRSRRSKFRPERFLNSGSPRVQGTRSADPTSYRPRRREALFSEAPLHGPASRLPGFAVLCC
jgi:hypothetical protein